GVLSNPPNCFDYGPYRQDLAGGPNPYSPKWQINATMDYDFDVGGNGTLTPRLSYSYTASQYQTIRIAPPNYIAAHSILDASMTYQNDKWNIEAYGSNLRNTLYIVGYTYGPSYFLGRPRQFGLRVTREF